VEIETAELTPEEAIVIQKLIGRMNEKEMLQFVDSTDECKVLAGIFNCLYSKSKINYPKNGGK
jgi:hypothetical protein